MKAAVRRAGVVQTIPRTVDELEQLYGSDADSWQLNFCIIVSN
jgi:hypothetical protein